MAPVAKAEGEAHDQNNPDKDKKKEVGDGTEANKDMGDDKAKDTTNPDKDKPRPDPDPTAKAREGQEDEGGNGSDNHGEREKSEKEDTTDEYKLETVERAIDRIDGVAKRLTGVKKTSDEDEKKDTEKAEDGDEKKDDEKEKSVDPDMEGTEKGMHPLDVLASSIAKAFEAMEKKLTAEGKSIPGFQKSLMDNLVNDSEFQAEVLKMLKVPGKKRSVVMGIPYVVEKSGRRYRLTAEGTEVEKSATDVKGKSFKEVYKSNFSSVKPEAE